MKTAAEVAANGINNTELTASIYNIITDMLVGGVYVNGCSQCWCYLFMVRLQFCCSLFIFRHLLPFIFPSKIFLNSYLFSHRLWSPQEGGCRWSWKTDNIYFKHCWITWYTHSDHYHCLCLNVSHSIALTHTDIKRTTNESVEQRKKNSYICVCCCVRATVQRIRQKK